MYPNLFSIEKWLEELTEEVGHLASPQPTLLKNAPFGYREVHYYDREHFDREFYVTQYGELAKSVLSKLDTFRDKELITNLDGELRTGQFDDKQAYLNKYIGKVAGIFSDLWMAGMDFTEVYDNVIPYSIKNVDNHDDGVKYFYEDEELELGNILYRISIFFKYSGHGYKANPDERTIESVLDKYATTSVKDEDSLKQNSTPTEPTVKLQWNAPKRALYDLFAQLTYFKTQDGKEVIGNTIKGLAQFIADNVEGMADAKTVERELEKMREHNGIEKAKRGRIELNIVKE